MLRYIKGNGGKLCNMHSMGLSRGRMVLGTEKIVIMLGKQTYLKLVVLLTNDATSEASFVSNCQGGVEVSHRC